jgi:hypothetical protein
MATTSSKHAPAPRGRQARVRDYNDALKDGRIAGPNAEEVVDAIARYSVTKDRDLIRSVIFAALHPDGELDAMAWPRTWGRSG